MHRDYINGDAHHYNQMAVLLYVMEDASGLEN